MGQLAAPNAQGVTMGHVHLHVKDVAAQTHFWVDIMGGKEVHNVSVVAAGSQGTRFVFSRLRF